jgi:hypothetical protein
VADEHETGVLESATLGSPGFKDRLDCRLEPLCVEPVREPPVVGEADQIGDRVPFAGKISAGFIKEEMESPQEPGHELRIAKVDRPETRNKMDIRHQAGRLDPVIRVTMPNVFRESK